MLYCLYLNDVFIDFLAVEKVIYNTKNPFHWRKDSDLS